MDPEDPELQFTFEEAGVNGTSSEALSQAIGSVQTNLEAEQQKLATLLKNLAGEVGRREVGRGEGGGGKGEGGGGEGGCSLCYQGSHVQYTGIFLKGHPSVIFRTLITVVCVCLFVQLPQEEVISEEWLQSLRERRRVCPFVQYRTPESLHTHTHIRMHACTHTPTHTTHVGDHGTKTTETAEEAGAG